jgi:hypothetical protein
MAYMILRDFGSGGGGIAGAEIREKEAGHVIPALS